MDLFLLMMLSVGGGVAWRLVTKRKMEPQIRFRRFQVSNHDKILGVSNISDSVNSVNKCIIYMMQKTG